MRIATMKWFAGFALLPLALAGCRSLPPQAPMDFSGAEWSVQQGQVVWRPDGKTDGVAGELLLASDRGGRSVVQFTKTPLPFLVAERTPATWQVHFIPMHKTYGGHGAPPARIIWLHLAAALRGEPVTPGFQFSSKPGDGWRFERSVTGETLEGYLEPSTPHP
ncbi:MAG: hypothetical protein QOF48_2185 [Verrucomicrobiota bacterium]